MDQSEQRREISEKGDLGSKIHCLRNSERILDGKNKSSKTKQAHGLAITVEKCILV